MTENEVFVIISGEKNHIVVQENSLIDAWQDMTANEKKMKSYIISAIDSRNVNCSEFRFGILNSSRDLELSVKNEHRDILSILERLQTRLFWIYAPTEKNKDRYVRVPFLSRTVYYADSGEIGVSVHDDLKPYLLELKKSFTSIPLETYLALDTFFEIRFCEIIKKYKKFGKVVFEIEELRNKLGLNIYDVKKKLIKRKYSEYRDFKKYILLPSEKKLKDSKKNGKYASEEYFSFKEKRKGRKVTHIELIIHSHKKKTTENEENPSENKEEVIGLEESELKEKLLSYGVTKKNTLKFLKEKKEEYILGKIEYLESSHKVNPVRNKGRWLTGAIAEDWKPPKDFSADEAEKEKSEKREKLAKEREAKELERKKTSAAHKIKDEFLASLSDSEKADLLEKMQSDPENGQYVKAIDVAMGRSMLEKYILGYDGKLKNMVKSM